MGKLTEEVFDESCCDGGECSTNKGSAQSCGCDSGANWVCKQHQDKHKNLIFAVRALLMAADEASRTINRPNWLEDPIKAVETCMEEL